MWEHRSPAGWSRCAILAAALSAALLAGHSPGAELLYVKKDSLQATRLATRARLVAWVDANAPYYGSYFGRRNIAFRDRPDFRPVPTLQSALGLRPAWPAAQP